MQFAAVPDRSTASFASTSQCAALQPEVCHTGNGTGTYYCDSSKVTSMAVNRVKSSALQNCILQSCDAGFTLVGAACQPLACSPGAKKTCSDNTGSGSQTCLSNGLGFGVCEFDSASCKAGFAFNSVSKLCEAVLCDPNSASATISCSENNGSGIKTCSSATRNYGACSLTACDTGFHIELYTPAGSSTQQNRCVADICAPNSGPFNCRDGVGTGTRTCNSFGSNYNSCVINQCDAGYKLEGGVCVQLPCNPGQSLSCAVTNGTGTRTCTALGEVPVTCNVATCASGYVKKDNLCVKQICTPNSFVAGQCAIANAVGTGQSCSADGTSLSACAVTSCAAHFSISSDQKSCVQTSCANGAINPGNGCTQCAAGSEIVNGICKAKCDSANGFARQGDESCKCQPNAVNPQTSSCSNASGSGELKCNAQGMSYSCVYNSCSTGFRLDSSSNSCLACSNKPQNSNYLAGDISTCSWKCDSGFTKQGNTCVAVNVACGTGQYYNSTSDSCQACTTKPANSIYTSSGGVTNSCGYSCDTGFYLSGSVCTAKYQWVQKLSESPSSPAQCGTQITKTYSVVCDDATQSGVQVLSDSFCSIAVAGAKPAAQANSTYLDQVSCTCPAGTAANATKTACNQITYSWTQSGFSACSQSCGSGAQYQNVTCQSSQGQSFSDSYCASAGSKPATYQQCNTQACSCNNGAINYPSCNSCTYGNVFNGYSCVPQPGIRGTANCSIRIVNGEWSCGSSPSDPYGYTWQFTGSAMPGGCRNGNTLQNFRYHSSGAIIGYDCWGN